MYHDPTVEGSAPPLWQKVLYFGAFASDLHGDWSDQVMLFGAIGLVAWSAWLAYKRRRARARGEAVEPDFDAESRPIVAPFVVTAIAYLATPMVLIGTHLIFPRLGQWVLFGAVLAAPRFPARLVARAEKWALRIGIAAGANIALHCSLFAIETNDASRVIDELPPGRAATAVIWEARTFAFRNGTLTHLAAYYAARRHGAWAFAFARYLSVPVRFRPGAQPPWPVKGWEFSGEDYNPRCKYARAFPLVIIKAPDEIATDASGERDIRLLVFKRDASDVKLLSHHGRYWAFDTTGLPDDGTF
jgi:hypothetical protein